MASWLFVIGERAALDPVVRRRVMAFRDHIRVGALGPRDRFALYVTRGAFHNPTADQARIFSVGTVVSAVSSRAVNIAGEEFRQSVRIAFDRKPLPAREGMPFRPLVSQMTFIRKKRAWAAYVRKALVPIDDSDLTTIDSALRVFERTA